MIWMPRQIPLDEYNELSDEDKEIYDTLEKIAVDPNMDEIMGLKLNKNRSVGEGIFKITQKQIDEAFGIPKKYMKVCK